MAVVSSTVLKSFFQTGDFPTQSQFAALIDSLLHRIGDRGLLGLKVYDTLRSYEAGDSVIYNNAIYVANASTGPGPFNPLTWNIISGTTPGSVNFRGTWEADDNVPDLVNPVPPIAPILAGDYFVVSEAGTTDLDGITDWNVGDWAIYNGTVWGKVDNTDAVSDGTNVGGGIEIFKSKLNTLLQFKTITSSNGSLLLDATMTDTVDIRMNLDDISVSPNSTWSSLKIQDKLDEKVDALQSAVPGKLPVFNAGGQLLDSGFSPSDFLPSNAVASDIEISPIPGISATEVQGALQELQSEKMPLTIGVAQNFPYFDGLGNIYNSGYNFSSFLPATTQAINIPVSPSVEGASNVQAALSNLSSNKANVVAGSANNFSKLNGSGQLLDSGFNAGSFIATGSGPSAVGLGNVTNDRQLSAKAYVALSSVAAAQYNTAVDILVGTTPSLVAGDYYVSWYIELTGSATTVISDMEVKAGGTSIGHVQMKIKSNGDYESYSGFGKVTFTAGQKDMVVTVTKTGGAGTTTITFGNMRFQAVSGAI